MELNLDNFSIRRTNPSIAGSTGFSLGEERYIAKAQGLVGFEIFADDKLFIKNCCINNITYQITSRH